MKYYKVEYLGKNETTNLPDLGGIDGGDFSKRVSSRLENKNLGHIKITTNFGVFFHHIN